MKKLKIIILIIAVAVIAVTLIAVFRSQKPTQIEILGQKVNLLVADNYLEQSKGLSGTKIETLGADGMLFVFKTAEERQFWMNGMNYNLDLLWISDGKIMKIERNVPAPKRGEDPVRMYSRPFDVDMVIELPAGGVDKFGFIEGQILKIDY